MNAVAQVQQAAPGGRPGRAERGASAGTIVAEPSVADLSAIPAGVYDPNNQLDRWKRGEIDLTENERHSPRGRSGGHA